MGYSLTIKTRSAKLRGEMIAFLKENYKSFGDASSPPEDHGRKGIVIYYSSFLHGEERLYVYSLIRWMALQVGTTRSRFNRNSVQPNVFDPPVPFMVYDDYEAWPILACNSEKQAMENWPKSLWWRTTDLLGIYLSERTSQSIVSSVSEKIFGDEKLLEAYQKAMEKLGPVPNMRWLEKKKRIQAKILRPEIQSTMKKVRAELRRLDRLWRTREK